MKRKFSKVERRLLWTSGISMLVLLGFGWWWTWSNTDPQITFASRPAPPKTNAFDFYVKAEALLSDSIDIALIVPLQSIEEQKRNPNIYYPLKEYETNISANTQSLNMAKQGFSYEFQKTNDEGIQHLDLLCRLFEVECRLNAGKGNWSNAAQGTLGSLHVAIDLCKEGSIGDLIEPHIYMNHSFQDLETIANKLDARSARLIRKNFHQLMAKYPSTTGILNSEKQHTQTYMMKIFQQINWRTKIKTGASDSITSLFGFGKFIRQMTLSKRSIMQNYTEVADAAIVTAQKPYAPFNLKGHDFFSDQNSDIYRRVIFGSAKLRTRAELLETALALRAYKLEKEGYPASLNELVPEHLPSVPQDVFANKPLRYKREGTTYKLWSIGPDGRDDGGKPAKNANAFQKQQYQLNSNSIGDFVYGVNQ